MEFRFISLNKAIYLKIKNLIMIFFCKYEYSKKLLLLFIFKLM